MPFTVQAKPRISATQFANVLTKYKSPAAPAAAECYQIIVGQGIDPAVALAFFGHESVFGTQGIAVKTLNWGNVRTPFNASRAVGKDPANFAIFPSWQVGLLDWCERINERYVKQRKLSTPEQIIPVYAPSSDGNNTTRYIEHVNELINRWMAEDPAKPAAEPTFKTPTQDSESWGRG